MKDFFFLIGTWFISLADRARAWEMVRSRADYILNAQQRELWEREEAAKKEFGLMNRWEWERTMKQEANH